MYGPAPSRVNKTGITRSRSGCMSCRKRRKKCDEKRPCSSCRRLGIPCQQPTQKLAFRTVSFADDPDSNQPNTSASVTAQAESELGAQTPEVIQVGTSLSNYTAGSTDSDPMDPLDNQFTSFLNDCTSQSSPGFVDTPSMLDANVNYDDYIISPSLLNINDLDQSYRGLLEDGPENTDGNAPPTSLQSQLVLPMDNDCQLSMGTPRAFGQLIFYSDIWDTHCLPGLHPALKGLGRSWQMPALLKDAVLALAACQLSRMAPQRKSFDLKGIPGLSFRPHLDHQTVSCEKYGSALMRLASWSNIANVQGFNEALTGMILLAHLESLMGDFRQFASHQTGIDALLCQLTDVNILPDHSTCQLIAGWTQARAQNWWLRFHFSTPDHHRRSPSMACSPWLTTVLEKAQDSRSIVMVVLCESCRLASLAFLKWWEKSAVVESDTSAAPIQTITVEEPSEQHAYPDIAPVAVTEDTGASLTCAITTLRATLNRWHRRLPLSQLPIESFMEPPSTAFPDEALPFELSKKGAFQFSRFFNRFVQSIENIVKVET
ncbi:hypothetical protein FSARC_9329 [Fusarium sarcochroum]|uniref:Zn(2)-C6 fungal-type domain-containing protein n=1 Tax=Fusarium sarcochroum TaxID=1208366 RepID=A0A8H4X6A7_9HYPO|nr:hypothetical protein FSARC_9329 [Fusarium sarcochroum]